MKRETKIRIASAFGMIAMVALVIAIVLTITGGDAWIPAYVFLVTGAIGLFTTCTL